MMNSCVTRAQRGDPAALSALIETLRPRIARMAAHYARQCRQDQDDLQQEAWTGLLEALPSLDPRIGSPEQYLIRYARWRLLDAIRRAHLRRAETLDPEVVDPVAHVALEHTVTALFIADFANRLKSTQRAVLACLMAGLTWREAGDALGCTSANIAYHVRQIRREYADWLDRGKGLGARG